MITQLRGRLVEKNPTDLVIDCNGVGYEVKISLNTFSNIGNNESITVFTQFVVREDAQILYGFHDKTALWFS
jgi:Holliday junction DNA helicase RuvA